MNYKINSVTVVVLLLTVLIVSCGGPKGTTNNNIPPQLTASTPVKGYNLLSKISGIWAGPVTSTTALGSYPDWIVDFRPISASQVSAKNELDTVNNIFMSFFIIYDGSQYRMAFRNGGGFSGMVRVSYMVCDSVTESASYSYYRFVDFVKGDKRTITELSFSGDSIRIRAFTNVNNSLPAATQVHMDWRAGLQDTTSCQAAKAAFSFPQKTLVKNFSTTFSQVTESVYYTFNGDPYPQSAQPYLGQSTLSYTVSSTLAPIPAGGRVFLIVTTQPLLTPSYTADMTHISRYVIIPSPDASFLFNYMHPGSYYLSAFYDADGNGIPSTGDYISLNPGTFTLSPLGTASATTQMNFTIP